LTNVSYNYKGGTGPAFQPDPRGSSAVVRTGLLTAEQVRRGGFVCFAAGIVCGLLLTWISGWTILALGVPAVIAGYSYAGPPLRIGHIALGVPAVFVFMGPVMVSGAYYVMAGHFSAHAFAASVPIGLLAAGIMHTNDIRDYAGDVAHGKRTLATLTGRAGASRLLAVINIAAYTVTAGAAALHWLPWTVLATLLTVPRAVLQTRIVATEDSPERLNQAWFRGVQLHMEFGILMILGLLAAVALESNGL
jgi:1,4-dihydroxy-2-naphthoate octaprenyltransferase